MHKNPWWAEPIQRQIELFGCTVERIDDLLRTSPVYHDYPLMFAGSILSDAQEAQDNGNIELSRQLINRAKYLIAKEHSRQMQAMAAEVEALRLEAKTRRMRHE